MTDEMEVKPYVQRNQPGHDGDGGRVVIPFTSDEQMQAILDLFDGVRRYEAVRALRPAGEPVAWRCAKCDCRSFARMDTRQADTSWGPGDFVRCVNCKDVSFYPASPAPSYADAIRDIAAERLRQISNEGWTPAHDDEHKGGELATAAGIYALVAGSNDRRWIVQGLSGNDYIAAALKLWPWEQAWFKPADRRRDLVKAGALIAAEIDRLDRIEALTPGSPL